MITYIADSLLKLQIKIGVNLISVELSQLFTLLNSYNKKVYSLKLKHIFTIIRFANSSISWLVASLLDRQSDLQSDFTQFSKVNAWLFLQFLKLEIQHR